MSAVTYSQPQVIEFFNQNPETVPLMIPFDTEPQAETYGLRWTPYLLVMDAEGKVHQRAIGFQQPGDLEPWVLMGQGKVEFNRRNWDAALASFGQVVDRYPQSFSAPECMYYKAVCLYRKTEEPAHLKEGHQRITEAFPDSVWAMRTLPYRKL
jgi:hypothetical protein